MTTCRNYGCGYQSCASSGTFSGIKFSSHGQPISLSEGVKRKWAASVDKEKFSVLFFWENFDNQISADPFATFSLVS